MNYSIKKTGEYEGGIFSCMHLRVGFKKYIVHANREGKKILGVSLQKATLLPSPTTQICN